MEKDDSDHAPGSCVITELGDEEPQELPQSAPESAQDGHMSMEADVDVGAICVPEGCEAVTPDRGVLKMVIEEGTGPTPPMHSRCLVHYVGRLADTGAVIMDTKTESHTMQPVHVVAGLVKVAKESGLNLAVATMRLGEKAMVYVEDPRYGYGDLGSFSFPSVPPKAKIVYDVELVDWEGAEEEGGDAMDERSGLLFEERLERAEQRRQHGNELFASGKFKEALGKYAVALSYLDEDLMMQLEGAYIEQAHQVKVPIHLNMAACQLQIKDYHTAIYNCTEVLTMEPDNVKAFFRRGKSRLALGQTDRAAEDLEEASKRAPDDKSVLRELHALRMTIKEERKAQASLFKGKFGSSPEPITKPQSGEEAGGSTRSMAGVGSEGPFKGAVNSQARSAAAAAANAPRPYVHRGIIGYMYIVFAWLARLLGIRIAQEQRA